MPGSLLSGPSPSDICASGASRVCPTMSRRAAAVLESKIRTARPRMGQMYISVAAKALISTAVALGSTVVGFCAPASADSGADFLAVVSKTGINVGDSPADVVLTLSRGMLACRLLHYGYPTEVAIREVGYGFPDATPAQLESFVDAAKAKLCEPNFRQLDPGSY